MRKLPRIVAETPIGIDVPVEVWRGGALTNVTARIGELEEAEAAQVVPASKTEGPDKAETGRVEAIGLELSSLTEALRTQHSIAETVNGVMVTGLDEGGPAAEKGLRLGDVIVEVDQTEVSTPSEVSAIVKKVIKKGRKKSVLFTINRQGSIQFVGLRVKKG